ncbi:hypothetical protein EBR96_04290, partial [bacterium]|nr:hypothetical protein [bacterium]
NNRQIEQNMTVDFYMNGKVVQSKNITVPARSSIQLIHQIRIPSTLRAVSIPFAVIAKSLANDHPINVRVSQTVRIRPIQLPPTIRKIDRFVIDASVPSADINDWIARSDESIWIATHPSVVRAIDVLARRFPVPGRFSEAALQIMDINAVINQLPDHSPIARTIHRELETRFRAAETVLDSTTNDLTHFPLSAFELALKFHLANLSGRGVENRALPQALMDASSEIATESAIQKGYAVGILVDQFGDRYPEFSTALALSQFQSIPHGIRPIAESGYRFAAGLPVQSPDLPTGNRLIIRPEAPASDAIRLIRMLPYFSEERIVVLVRGANRLHWDRAVKTAVKLPVSDSPVSTDIRSSSGHPVLLFRFSPPEPVRWLPAPSAVWTWDKLGSKFVAELTIDPRRIGTHISEWSIQVPLPSDSTVDRVISDSAVRWMVQNDIVVISGTSGRMSPVSIRFTISSAGIRQPYAGWVDFEYSRVYFRIPSLILRGTNFE